MPRTAAIYIGVSLMWLWVIDGQRPMPPDVIGAGVAMGGDLLIIGFAVKTR
jgi:drug/metabolite transporter superfamily protein YnfA